MNLKLQPDLDPLVMDGQMQQLDGCETRSTERVLNDVVSSPSRENGPWSPLASPAFRFLWIASVFSNLGTWIHEVGSSWMMTELNPAPEMVSAVRVAMAVPMTLVAIPAGLLADRLDRRWLLIVTDAFLMMAAAALSVGAFWNLVQAWSLLAMTFLMGIGMVVHVLTWQSSIPEIVPRDQLPRAIALGSLSFNLARSVGPAVGGIMIAYAGTWLTFAVNAVSYAIVLFVLLRWERPERTESSEQPSVRHRVGSGFQFIRSSQPLCDCYLRLSLFLIPASALWSLLPLIVRQRLGWSERGYGFMVTLIGIGAVVAAVVLHRLHAKLGMTRTLFWAFVFASVALCGLGITTSGLAAIGCTLILGSSWMMVLTTLNSATQLNLNQEFRARGMSVYYVTMAFCMSVGAFAWGQIAGNLGLPVAVCTAGVLMMALAFISNRFTI